MAEFSREACHNTIWTLLNSSLISPNDPVFAQQPQAAQNYSDIQIKIPFCQEQCGPHNGWYKDIGPRLTTWLVPIAILIGNMMFLYLGLSNWIFAIIHLLGDPIDSLWSLLTTLEATNRCWDLAEHLSSVGGKIQDHVRDRGTVLVAIYEVEGILRNPRHKYEEIVDVKNLNDKGKDQVHLLLRRVANELSDSTSSGLFRAVLAVVGYAYSVLGAFTEAIGGKSTSQPGRRIGIAMFLSWVLPVVLISNLTTTFSSRRTAWRALERFAHDCVRIQTSEEFQLQREESIVEAEGSVNPGSPTLMPIRTSITSQKQKPRRLSTPYEVQFFSDDYESEALRGRVQSSAVFPDAQPYLGGINVYQPNKRLFSATQGTAVRQWWRTPELGPWMRFCIALLPFLIAEVHSFLLIWFTPTTGLTCTHLALFGIFGVWIFSALFTHLLWTTRVARGKYHFYAVLIKDVLIALPCLGIIVAISCGWFNSCRCWSSYFSRGWSDGYINTNPDAIRKNNAKSIYLGLVLSCIAMQCLSVFLVSLLTYRGRRLCARSEDRKNRDFWHFHPTDTNNSREHHADSGIGLLEAADDDPKNCSRPS